MRFFSKPTIAELVSAELDEARRIMLLHQSALERHQAAVNEYYARIARLEGMQQNGDKTSGYKEAMARNAEFSAIRDKPELDHDFTERLKNHKPADFLKPDPPHNHAFHLRKD